MHVGLYNGSLTREQFMFREMRIVARLYKNGLSNAEITDTVYRDNLFQYPTERVIKKLPRRAQSSGMHCVQPDAA